MRAMSWTDHSNDEGFYRVVHDEVTRIDRQEHLCSIFQYRPRAS